MATTQAQELIALLRDVEKLGLSFDCGTAYIRRSYIDQQDALRVRIDEAVKALEAEDAQRAAESTVGVAFKKS